MKTNTLNSIALIILCVAVTLHIVFSSLRDAEQDKAIRHHTENIHEQANFNQLIMERYRAL